MARCRLILRNRRSACTWSLCQCLLAAAEACLVADPRRAQELAALAVEEVEGLDPCRYRRPLIADLAAHAWGTVAEALRRRHRRRAAEAALGAAALCLVAGSAEPLEEAAPGSSGWRRWPPTAAGRDRRRRYAGGRRRCG